MTEELLQYLLRSRFKLGVAVGLGCGYMLASVVTMVIFNSYWPECAP